MLRRSITSLLAIGAVSALLTLSPQRALALPTLQVENGILMGATGVNVGGTLYDVQFVDGTCAALFSGCDDVTDVAFQGPLGAIAAANALLNQVFNAGPHDEQPALTNGCSGQLDRAGCHILTPGDNYGFGILPLASINMGGDNSDFISWHAPLGWPFTDTTDTEYYTWAQWTPAQSVPEPSTAFLLISSLLGLAGYQWRQRRQIGVQVG